MYYKHGANSCGEVQSKHFLSLHSWLGIVILAIFWWQTLSALAVFTNNALLAPHSAPREIFAKYHRFFGYFTTFGGLVTLLTGLLKVEKDQTPADRSEFWFTCTAVAVLVTGILLALTLYEHKSESESKRAQVQEATNDPLLVASSSPASI